MTDSHSITRRAAVKLGAALGISQALPAFADDTMLTRPIPGSTESLPVIGLGTYSVFDVAGSEAEIAERRAIVAKLIDAGGSVIDTSPMYNRSEAVIGKVLDEGSLRASSFLATKVWIDGADAGRRQMQASANLMGTERVDLMQVHNRRDLEAHWPTILAAQEAGTIRYNGVTDYRESAIDSMMAIMRETKPEFIQMNYSLGERALDRRLLPLAQDLGIAVLINRPFMSGRLFQAVKGVSLPDWASEFAQSWGQFFLKYIVSHPAVTCVIPATSKLRHMIDNSGAGMGPMPDEATRRRMVTFVESL